MPGLGQKIKEKLTPGHKHHANEGVYNEPMGTAAPIGTNDGMMGTHTTGMGGDLVGGGRVNDGVVGTHAGGMGTGIVGTGRQGSSSSSSSSDDEGVAGVRTTTGACETRTFTEVEDRPVMRERVERIIEHRPVEKQFVVETRPVGEREVADGVHYESAGVREYEVDRVQGSKCPSSATDRVL
jgi:hypothetical protein